jgi:Mg-chelatase subunit ChlD
MDTNNQKTNIYNIIILDKSGSMESIKQEAISGYNETLQSIISAQTKHAETQQHFVTLVTFNSDSTDTVYNRVACTKAAELTSKTYQPYNCTPLYDTMGNTLTKFRNELDMATDHRVLVTIITDGMENASKEYSGKQIHQMVTELEALGWVFTYIGANHNVKEAAMNMGIRNSLAYAATKEGTNAMYEQERMSRNRFYDRVADGESSEELQDGFFDL